MPPRAPSKVTSVPVPAVELLVLHRPANTISRWWQISQMFSFFICTISGLAVCISMGRIQMAFGGDCILYGGISLTRVPQFSGHIRARHLNSTEMTWGKDSDCNYCQYFPMAGACAAIVMGVLFLEFGSTDRSWFLNSTRSGRNRSYDSTWKMVLPGIIVSLVFFIASCVALAFTVGGLLSFCDNVIQNSSKDVNLTSCDDVYHLSWEIYRLPNELQSVDVFVNVLISEIGASLHFAGWFLSLLILLARCGSSVDFVTVRRGKIRRSVDSTETFPVVFDEDDDTSEEESSLLSLSQDVMDVKQRQTIRITENISRSSTA
ncbi:unnamed protein product [Allacma fusca]|uniref:Transmembrane protein n=1 Tax=Allacma fusca TaxID=39272 RepID=A0A8J2KS40_9HEXA|nr:unnamed protein product [Allacma fusca]